MRWFKRSLWLAVAWRFLGPVLPIPWTKPQAHPWRIPARTYYVGDRELSVREVGPSDASPIVLIHGLAGSSMAEWYKVAPLLAASHRIVMIDQRSHGLSVADRGRFEISDLADDLADIIGQLGLGLVTLVGYSMGGVIAQQIARDHPHLLAKLVLIATMSHHPQGWRQARMLGAILARGWERFTGTGTPEVRTGYLLATGAVERRHARWLWEETHRRDPDAGAEASLALFRFDSRSWLGQLDVPTLVFIPTRDQLVPASWQRKLATEIKNAEVVEIGGGHHEVPWTHAELLAERIARFVLP